MDLRYPLLYAIFCEPLTSYPACSKASYPCRRLQTRCTITLMER